MNQLLDVAQKIYGKHKLNFFGSPLEGKKNDAVELILHELCHQVFLDVHCSIGDMDWTFQFMSDALDKLPKWQSDLHEIRTAAAELLVAEKFKLAIPNKVFHFIVSRNLQTFNTCMNQRSLDTTPEEDIEILIKIIQTAQRTPKVQFAAAQVIELFRM